MYAYVGGDPVNFTDSSGTLGECAGTLIGSTCGNAARSTAKDLIRKSEMASWSESSQSAAIDMITDYLLGRRNLDAVANTLYSLQADARWTSAMALESSSNSWTTGDFLSHYFDGSGTTVDLSDIGLSELYLSHPTVTSLTGSYMSALEGLSLQNFWAPQTQIGHSVVTDTIFSLGKSALYAAGGCQGADCFFRFTINDAFENPIHIGVEIPFGVPYRIVYEWSVVKRRTRR
jgi:hypothetical protein